MSYLTKTCKHLKNLELTGSGIIGDSLTAALPFAQSLTSLTVSANYEISVSVVIKALNICKNTLIFAKFLRVKGNMMNFGQLKAESLKKLYMRTHSEGSLNTVCWCSSSKYIPRIHADFHLGWPFCSFSKPQFSRLDRLARPSIEPCESSTTRN